MRQTIEVATAGFANGTALGAQPTLNLDREAVNLVVYFVPPSAGLRIDEPDPGHWPS